MSLQKIVPHLWFDKEAKEAAEFYTSLFPNSKVIKVSTIHDTPSGDCDIVTFEVLGKRFMSISAGPYFQFNPSISFMVSFDTKDPSAHETITKVWDKLSEEGTALMPFDKYPFSEKYGWIQDKYGLSWQLMLVNSEEYNRPPIVPSLLFVNDNCGKAEEAMEHYVSIFENAKLGTISRYPKGMEPDKEGTIMYADFMLEKQWFVAMDSAHNHQFNFNEAVSFMVYCDNQEEIDHYWDKLSSVPEAEQCGWLKDQFGISWQIVPTIMDEFMEKGTPEQVERANQATLQMKKLIIEDIKRAYEGK
ncbi:VOC family protein [Ureibacillus thermosphaericus]|uniref:VOC family protein n=1 Tax=Ureibacillus thermosphaericus TaxID=51173 RepID=UPI0030C968C5